MARIFLLLFCAPRIDRSRDLDTEGKIREQLIKDNLLRRHLTDYQKVVAGKELEPIYEAQARERQLSSLKQNTSIVKVKFPERWKGQSRDHVAKDLEARDASRARLDAPEDPELAARLNELLSDPQVRKILERKINETN